MVPMDLHIWVTIAIIAAAVALYATERISMEVSSIGAVVAFLVFFHFFPVTAGNGSNLLGPEALLSGFAHPALVTVLSLLVVGQGLFHTGALETPTRYIVARGAGRPGLTLLLVLLLAGIISAFMNNTPVVIMFVPVISALTARLGLSISKTIMPLSFISILGGMTTLIGSSTNLLVAGVAERYGLGRIGFFEFALPGLFLATIGGVYTLFVVPRILQPRQSMADTAINRGGKQFIAQIPVSPDHPLEGSTSVAGLFPALKNMTVRMVQRGEHPFYPPFEDVVLRSGDLVVVAATREAITDALKVKGGILSTTPQQVEDDDGNGEAASAPAENDEPQAIESGLTLAEAVVAPGSRLIGRRIEQAGLHTDTGCLVLGIQRRSRMIRVPLSDIRLEAGDVILFIGTRRQILGLRSNRDVLLLEWSATELPDLRFAARARFIFAATVASAALGLLPIVIAALAGAVAMIASGCLNVRQAARAIDRRIFVLVGAAIAMAVSLEATGGAQLLAESVVHWFSGYGPAYVLSAIFLLVAILTNFLSNNATAVLFTPIAINAANALEADPRIFVFTVIFAANCSFATPMAYQTNLLVMGPGHYRFNDFVRAGVPLIFLIWLAYSLFAPWYYGLAQSY